MANLDQMQQGARAGFSTAQGEKEGLFLYWIATPGVRYAQICYQQGTTSQTLGVRGVHETRIRWFQNVERYEEKQEVEQ